MAKYRAPGVSFKFVNANAKPISKSNYFINVLYPTPDIYFNNIFNISGTTNAPNGSNINIEIVL